MEYKLTFNMNDTWHQTRQTDNKLGDNGERIFAQEFEEYRSVHLENPKWITLLMPNRL